ncbi:MAG TPA: hypothetical protein DCG79_03690 [Clostridiales bacterium]|nr:hypothetical protein [Clostridiales bacterium]
MLYYEFKAQIARGDIAPLYRIDGEDKYWAELAYKDLLALSSELDTEVLRDDQPVEDAVFGVQNFPMMAERKLVVIRDRKLKDADVKILEEYLRSPVDSGVILIYNCEGKVKGERAFTFDAVTEGELVPYIERLAREMGGSVTSSAARKLASYTEMNMTRIKNELLKMIALGEITDDLVAAYVEPSYSYRVFDFTDAIARGSYTGAYEVLSSLARNPAEYSPFFTKLTDYIRLMLHAKLAKNVPDAALAQALGVSPYPLQKAKRAAANYTPRQLLAILMKMYSLEQDYKSGAIGVENAMDLAIAEAIEARKK